MGILDPPGINKAEVIRLSGTQVGSNRGKDWRRISPITTDITSISQSNTPDGTLNHQYILGNSSAIPSTYPVDLGLGTIAATTNAFGYAEYSYPLYGGHTIRMMTDAPKLAIKFGYVSSAYAYQVFIDGAPVTLDPVVGNAGLYLTMVFPSSGRARLVEICMRAGVGSIYVAQPYRVWKPGVRPAPKILVMGDSYAMTTSYDNSGNALPGEYGMYHRMPGDLGVVNMSVDGVGGTGYIFRNAGGIGAPNNNYADRLASAIALAPDVLIIHGGGANDLANGYTTAQIITAATNLFQAARAGLPNAKLVFIEGFAPPVFGSFNASYTTIRAGVQANCMNTGVYYVDVSTTDPWLSGTGYYGATNGTGNSDIYVGPDGTHLLAKGSDYLRSRMADRLRAILADNGALVNTLI